MKRIYWVICSMVLLLIFQACVQKAASNRKQTKSVKKQDSIETVSILFAGDVIIHQAVLDATKLDDYIHFDYSSIFSYISPIIKEADVSVANLESTFGGIPYTGYPAFSSPDTVAWFLKKAGFDVLVTANNHAADKGNRGITGTIDAL